MTLGQSTRQLGPVMYRMILILAFHRVMNMNGGWVPKSLLAAEYTPKYVHRFRAELFPNETDVISSSTRYNVLNYRLDIPHHMINFDWLELDEYVDEDLKPFYLATKQIIRMKERR